MKLLITFLLTLLTACSNTNDLNSLTEKQPSLSNYVSELNKTPYTYKTCEECHMQGLQGEELNGFTDRYPPHGHYDKKTLNIGSFDYDAYNIIDNDNKEIGTLYFCYFDRKQHHQFVKFAPYYQNLIGHGKQSSRIKRIENTTIIRNAYEY